MMMKIGFDAKRVFHNFRGLGNYSRTLIEGLLEFYPDCECHLYTPVFGDLRSLAWQKKFSAAKIHTPNSFLGSLAHPLWRSFGLGEQVVADGMDIYHGLSHEIPYKLEKSAVKKVVTVHDLIFMRHPRFFTVVDRKTYEHKLRYATRVADVVVATSEQTKKDLVDFLQVPESKIKIVYQSCSPEFYEAPTGVQLEAVQKKYQLPQEFILSVGAIEARKNYRTLIEAFAQIKDHVAHSLVIVGRGAWKNRKPLETGIARLGLRDRVKILQDVSHEDLPAIYRSSDLLAYPSLFEGFGIPIVEALFSGVPVVTTQGSCFPESGGPDSVYVDTHRPDLLASAMAAVLNDREKHRVMAVKGRAYAQKFHLRQTTDVMMKVYKSL